MVDIVKCQMLKIAINRLEILEKRGFTVSRFLKQLEFRLKDRLVEQISIDWVPALKPTRNRLLYHFGDSGTRNKEWLITSCQL